MPKLPTFDPETWRRLGRFLVVGGGSAALQFIVLAGLQNLLTATWAFSVSWVVSTGAHYLANRFWALPSARHDTVRQLGEYLFAIALSYGVSVTAFHVAHRVLGLGVMWAAFWSVPLSILVVFPLLNYRVFRARFR